VSPGGENRPARNLGGRGEIGEIDMDLGIAGKVAVVTGGSHGMGRAISEELGRNGCRVVVVARGQAQLDATVESIRRGGGEAISVSADLTSFDSFPAIVEAARAAYDDPEIAIYAPVAPPPGAFDDFTDADFDRAYANIVKGFAHFARAVVPGMKAKGWGRIVTLGSGAAKSPARRSVLNFDYALANVVRPAGLGLSRTLADELAPFGITVNTVPPGFIDTGENYEAFFRTCASDAGLSYDDFMTAFLKRIPANRFGRPEEVAGLTAFLCGQSAGYITGQYLLVDGGFMQSYF
jgi:3-oxoacyl-[acyl-carrier protein] reductase